MSDPADPVAGASGLVPLTAQANDATTEVFIIDGRFNLVGKGLGRVEAQVAPGMYKVKFKAGDSFKEVRRAVRPGKSLEVAEETPVHFNSPAPIYETALTHEYHLEHAAAVSGRVHARLGRGSKLFVFVRDFVFESERQQPDRQFIDEPASGLTLHDPSGKLLIDFSANAEKTTASDEADKWAGCTLELDPGYYRLRVDAGEMGTFEQSVVTCRGWQTQVFLLRRNYAHEDVIQRADLSGASILMARMEQRFDPWQRGLRLSEMARKGLESGRLVVPDAVLRAAVQDESLKQDRSLSGANRDVAVEEMLYGKHENPMLGICGAHLLLGTPDTPERRDLLRTVVANLRRLVGDDHPDVRALDLCLGEEGQNVAAFAAPPMLRSSWKIIVAASVSRPDIVPSRSLAGLISPHTWGNGAWLVWRAAPDLQAQPAVLDASFETKVRLSSRSFSDSPEGYSAVAPAILAIETGDIAAASRDADAPATAAVFLTLCRTLQRPANLKSIAREFRYDRSVSRAVITLARQARLTSLEANLASYVYETALRRASTQFSEDAAVGEDSVDPTAALTNGLQQLAEIESEGECCSFDLVQVLGVPRAVVDEAVRGLILKLKLFAIRRAAQT